MLTEVCQMSSPSKKQTSLPEVFMIKHMNGEIQKLSLLKYGIVNCEKYVSKKKVLGLLHISERSI